MSYKQQKTDLLVFGYVHQIKCNIPIVITELIKRFYDDVSYWNVSRNDLKHAFIGPNTKSMLSKSIHINDIQFNLFIDQNKRNGYLYWGFGLQSLPSNIKYITCFCTLSCEIQNKVICKSFKIKKSTPNLHKQQFIRTCDWSYYDEIIFNCSIKIGRIKYE